MQREDYYSGDRVFDDFVKALDGHVGATFGSWSGRASLVDACRGDAGLALAVFYVSGERSLEWMDERVPALGGSSPRKCLTSSKRLARLKEALLRFRG
jgi:hypothetical protein